MTFIEVDVKQLSFQTQCSDLFCVRSFTVVETLGDFLRQERHLCVSHLGKYIGGHREWEIGILKGLEWKWHLWRRDWMADSFFQRSPFIIVPSLSLQLSGSCWSSQWYRVERMEGNVEGVEVEERK